MINYTKYDTNSQTIGGLIGDIINKNIAIPEIQRPFVWRNSQVRDLIDSLYKGYPTGYIIEWHSPSARVKDGTSAVGKKLLIDGQQRVTALMTAIAGEYVVNSKYEKVRIKIAFDPFAALSEEKDATIFAVQSVAIAKDKRWIPDIAEVFKADFKPLAFIRNYCQNNPTMDEDDLESVLTKLKEILGREIGVISLSNSLDIDVVTDIFIRINSKGTTLSQGDFVMSKISADDYYGGNELRKVIDYFAHLSLEPTHYDLIVQNDNEFAQSEYAQKLKWLRKDVENVYDPTCDDILRVAFMTMYPRAKLSDLVNLLSGRDFEERTYKTEIIEDTYKKLKAGVDKFVNEDNFKQFMIAIRSAGFISNKLVNSQMAIDFAYVLYLRLKETKEVDISELKSLVQKWYVLSVLTRRYSASPETTFYHDLRRINEKGVKNALREMEDATLSDNFWEAQIPQDLDAGSTINPTLQVYLAAQVFFNDLSLLSNSTTVRELIEIAGDVHHVFPKAYLKKNNFEKLMYNQDANYAYLDTQVNKSIGEKSPNVYFKHAFEQCETKEIQCGSIVDIDKLKENLKANCIPDGIENMNASNYEEFLVERRKLMALKIKEYYYSL